MVQVNINGEEYYLDGWLKQNMDKLIEAVKKNGMV